MSQGQGPEAFCRAHHPLQPIKDHYPYYSMRVIQRHIFHIIIINIFLCSIQNTEKAAEIDSLPQYFSMFPHIELFNFSESHWMADRNNPECRYRFPVQKAQGFAKVMQRRYYCL